MTWYVVAEPKSAFDGYPDPTDQVFTVSKDPNKPGWDTDSGCEGYGLTQPEADFLAAAANEKEARDGVEGPWTPNRTRVG